MKKVIAFLIALALLCGVMPAALAASDEAIAAAEELFALGLFSGVGTNEDGTPNFDLDREPTRNEAVTMLVRLLGKEEEAKAGTWEMPFTDVAEWAKPYVGYAYANKLTYGTGETTFGGQSTVSATQYLTFVLRAMGYDSGTDFQWNRAWELSDAIGMTDGRYNAESGSFLRGDVAIISTSALAALMKNRKETLAEKLIAEGVFTEAQYLAAAGSGDEAGDWKAWYEVDDRGGLWIRTNIETKRFDSPAVFMLQRFANGSMEMGYQPLQSAYAEFRFDARLSYFEPGSQIVGADLVVIERGLTFFPDHYRSCGSLEEAVETFPEKVIAWFQLDNRIVIEELQGYPLEITSFSLAYNEDGRHETYTATIAGDILAQGEYGLKFDCISGRRKTGMSSLRKGEGALTATQEIHYFADPGAVGDYCVCYCIHEMEESGTIHCRRTQSDKWRGDMNETPTDEREDGQVRWSAPGRLAWNEADGAVRYVFSLLNEYFDRVLSNSTEKTEMEAFSFLGWACVESSQRFRLEVEARYDDREKAVLGSAYIDVTVEGEAAVYTAALSEEEGGSYTLTLGSPVYEDQLLLRTWLVQRNCKWTEFRHQGNGAYTDSGEMAEDDRLDVRVLTESALDGSEWIVTVTPPSILSSAEISGS